MASHFISGLILYLIFLISLCVHEWSHGFIAHLYGDQTAKYSGRLTLNPLTHIDLLGTVIIPLSMILLSPGIAIIGWAKPVPIDPRAFRNKKFADIIVSLAGPFSNFLMAFLGAIIGGFCIKFINNSLGQLFGTFIIVNICLGIFNLIPLPPLDGSHLAKKLFKISEQTFDTLSQYSFFILIILINIPLFKTVFSFLIFKIFLLLIYLPSIFFNVNRLLFLPM